MNLTHQNILESVVRTYFVRNEDVRRMIERAPDVERPAEESSDAHFSESNTEL